MSKYLIVTGGAGFIGSNLIELLVRKTKDQIISIDNYSTGSKTNHIKSNRVKYINNDTQNFDKILKNYKKKKISAVFHFAEFSRIYQSFNNVNECFASNIKGTNQVINFRCKTLIYII